MRSDRPSDTLDFPELLERWRELRKLTQAQLGERCERSADTISRYERAKECPSEMTLSRLIEALELEPDDASHFRTKCAAFRKWRRAEQQRQREAAAQQTSREEIDEKGVEEEKGVEPEYEAAVIADVATDAVARTESPTRVRRVVLERSLTPSLTPLPRAPLPGMLPDVFSSPFVQGTVDMEPWDGSGLPSWLSSDRGVVVSPATPTVPADAAPLRVPKMWHGVPIPDSRSLGGLATTVICTALVSVAIWVWMMVLVFMFWPR